MLVCHCEGVTEREIECAIGAGARTRRDVARQCGAGRVCGGCHPVIDELLDGGHGSTAPHHFELSAAS